MKYSQEFKQNAVKLYLKGGVTYKQLASDLGISDASLEKWVREARRNNGVLSTSDYDELKLLRKENKRLREEREILKKAAAFFAEESTLRR